MIKLLNWYIHRSFTHLGYLQVHLMHLGAAGKPSVVAVRRGCADSVELVEERRHKAAWATNILFRCCVFRCNLIHENAGQHGQEFVRSMSSQEAAGDCADGAASL